MVIFQILQNDWILAINYPKQLALQFHPMRIISVVLICDTWEICLVFCKQIPDRKFLKLSLLYPPLKFLHSSVWIQSLTIGATGVAVHLGVMMADKLSFTAKMDVVDF